MTKKYLVSLEQEEKELFESRYRVKLSQFVRMCLKLYLSDSSEFQRLLHFFYLSED